MLDECFRAAMSQEESALGNLHDAIRQAVAEYADDVGDKSRTRVFDDEVRAAASAALLAVVGHVDAVSSATHADAVGPEFIAAYGTTIRTVVEALWGLPEVDQQLLEQRYMYQRTVSEIADRVKLGSPAVVARLQSALIQLGQRLFSAPSDLVSIS